MRVPGKILPPEFYIKGNVRTNESKSRKSSFNHKHIIHEYFTLIHFPPGLEKFCKSLEPHVRKKQNINKGVSVQMPCCHFLEQSFHGPPLDCVRQELFVTSIVRTFWQRLHGHCV